MRCRADERVEDSHYSQEYSLALFQKLVQRNIIIFSRDGGVEGLNTKNPQESANANENMPLAHPDPEPNVNVHVWDTVAS